MVEVAPPQDLGEFKMEPPNPQWGSIKPFFITPDAGRLSKPSQRVVMKNTSPNQVMIIRDRFEQGQELQPGESREMEMTAEDIAYFLRESRMRRVGTDQKIHTHPVVVEGVSEESVQRTIDKWTEEQKASEAEKAKSVAREQLVELFRDAGISQPTATVTPPPAGDNQVRRTR